MKNVSLFLSILAMVLVATFTSGCVSRHRKNVEYRSGPAGTSYSDHSESLSVGMPVSITVEHVHLNDFAPPEYRHYVPPPMMVYPSGPYSYPSGRYYHHGGGYRY
ncbi:MAG: hypothetical protein AAB777_01380 [Patescibacteria group bacterium]